MKKRQGKNSSGKGPARKRPTGEKPAVKIQAGENQCRSSIEAIVDALQKNLDLNSSKEELNENCTFAYKNSD